MTGLVTAPDWLEEASKVAVYLDGLSRGRHGDLQAAQWEPLLRGLLELDGYAVLVVPSGDLEDPQAARQHLWRIAQALGRSNLPI